MEFGLAGFDKFGTWVTGLLFIIIFAASIGCFWLGVDLLSSKAALERSGIDTTAIVASRKAEGSGYGSPYYGGPEMKPVYTIGYRFLDQTGEIQLFEKTVPLRIYGTMQVGDEVPVRYLPSDPATSEIVSGAIGLGALNLIFAGCLLGLACLFGAISCIVGVRKSRI